MRWASRIQVYTLPANIEYYFEKTKYIALGTSIAALLNLVLNYIFIKAYGYVAAAYTTLVTYLLYFILHYLIGKKLIGRSIFDEKIIVFCSVGIIASNILFQFLIGSTIIRWVLAVVIGIVFVVWEEKKFGLGQNVIQKFIHK